MNKKKVGVLGATSLVGRCLLPLLTKNGWLVRAYSRRKVNSSDPDIQWIQIPKSPDDLDGAASERQRRPLRRLSGRCPWWGAGEVGRAESGRRAHQESPSIKHARHRLAPQGLFSNRDRQVRN